jgi:hypothetical protein
MNKKNRKKEKNGILKYVPCWALVLYGAAFLALLTDIPPQ